MNLRILFVFARQTDKKPQRNCVTNKQTHAFDWFEMLEKEKLFWDLFLKLFLVTSSSSSWSVDVEFSFGL